MVKNRLYEAIKVDEKECYQPLKVNFLLFVIKW